MKLSRNPAFTTALPIVLYLIFVFVFFAGPLTGHGSLSKAHILAEWDSLFDAQRTGQSILMDPSLLYLMIPSYILKAQLLHGGQLPLWNPYTGLGAPLLADPQSLAFSPLHLPLLLAPTTGMLSLVLALEVAILGVSTYMLCRELKLSVFASTFAMIIASMCPYHLYYLELLGNGFCMVPLAFWMIARLKGDTLLARLRCAWISALGLACCIYSAHVEMSFFAITLACLCKLLSTRLNPATRKNIAQVLVLIAVTGLFTVLMAAPLLLPFVEFIKNSECYKFGSGAPAIIPWQAMLYNLLSPGYKGASPTLGPIALPLIVISFFNSKITATVRSYALVALAAIAVMCKLGPLESLFTYSPFSYIVVTYALPSTLIMLSVLAASGLDRAIEPEVAGHNRTNLIAEAIAAVAIVALFPLFAASKGSLSEANFDLCVGDYILNKADITRYALAAIGFAVALTWHKLKPSRSTATVLGAVAVCSYLALIVVSRRSMPTWPKFSYAQTATIKSLQDQTGHDRCIATGSHLFRSNTSDVYHIRDLRAHNPLFPKRFLGMLKLCDAHIDTFSQEFSAPLSDKLALCSINTVASQTPVAGEHEAVVKLNCNQALAVQTSAASINLMMSEPDISTNERAVFINLQSTGALPEQCKSWTWSYGLASGSGEALWFADQMPLDALYKKAKTLLTVPLNTQTQKPLKITIQIFDPASSAFVKMQDGRDSLTIATIDQTKSSPKSQSSQYKLVSEAEHIRIYKNSKALPRAFFVSNAHLVKNQEDALSYMQSSNYQPEKEVVLESDAPLQNTDKSEVSSAASIKFEEDSASKITLDLNLPHNGYLVLNDIWYPGWQANLDNKEVPILHGNYAMRAVKVTQGQHKLTFAYKPVSFTLGVAAWLVALIAGLLLAISNRLKARR